jgi:hypothetical protein
VWAHLREHGPDDDQAIRIRTGQEPASPESLQDLARRMGDSRGRPPKSTTITSDEQLLPAIKAMRTEGVRFTRATLAARAGFTLAEIRGYLRATHRTMKDLRNIV